jgi:two-component system OmpR family response regulator
MSAPLGHVMCIDDEDDILQVAKLSLEMVGGLKVSLCRGSKQAVEEAVRLRPDLILLDVMMPERDGPATLEALRADPGSAGIPVIFMTAKVQPAEVAHYRSLGAVGVISKPFDPMTLSDQIKTLWTAAKTGNPGNP